MGHIFRHDDSASSQSLPSRCCNSRFCVLKGHCIPGTPGISWEILISKSAAGLLTHLHPQLLSPLANSVQGLTGSTTHLGVLACLSQGPFPRSKQEM